MAMALSDVYSSVVMPQILRENNETGGFQKNQATYFINNCYWISNYYKDFKDVPAMLTIVSAVRKVDWKVYFSAEREIFKLIFAFNYINYSRRNIYQHVYLNNLLRTKTSTAKKIW